MLCLSVKQPWAWAIFNGKDIENRTWAFPYPMPNQILIHACKNFELAGIEYCERMGLRVPPKEDLIKGAIAGVVEVFDCVKSSKQSGWGQPGQFHWKLRNQQQFKIPIPWKGRPDLFEVSDSLVNKQVEELNMQINLFEEKRELTEVVPNCWLIPNFFSLESQQNLLSRTRQWCKGLFHQPPIPGSNLKLAHPIACVGYDWIPYTYQKPKVAMPEYLQQLYYEALVRLPDTHSYLNEFEKHKPDTAVINWFPSGSSLGMHVDKSEEAAVRSLGNPIITIALGADADISVGGFFSKSEPTTKILMKSGDILAMHGKSRMRYHSVGRIYPNTSALEQTMKSPGRISITMRRAKV